MTTKALIALLVLLPVNTNRKRYYSVDKTIVANDNTSSASTHWLPGSNDEQAPPP